MAKYCKTCHQIVIAREHATIFTTVKIAFDAIDRNDGKIICVEQHMAQLIVYILRRSKQNVHVAEIDHAYVITYGGGHG
jgi:hypothetical protein